MKCRYELMVHRRVVHNCGSSEKCGVCGAAFGSQTELKQHRIACHSNRPFACPECPHRSKTREKMERHVASCHSSRETHRCDHCGKTFVFKNSLKKHTEKRRCVVLKQKTVQEQRRLRRAMMMRAGCTSLVAEEEEEEEEEEALTEAPEVPTAEPNRLGAASEAQK